MRAMYWIVAGVGTLCLCLLGWLAARQPRPRVMPYRPERVEDLPDNPRPFVVYVAGAGKNAWAASLVCPCGCDEVIELNLLQQVRPRWKVTENTDGTVSLHPSVWRDSGCRSHFIVANGAIRWCQSDEL